MKLFYRCDNPTEYETKQDIKKNDIGEDMYYGRSMHDLFGSL